MGFNLRRVLYALETKLDFFNTIGRFLPVATGGYGQFTARHG